jgi:hypothetical protein
MVAKLLTTSISAPGFYGLNTQDSVVSLESGYATVAMNCVIDKFGRIGARKGWTPMHSSLGALGSNAVEAIGELIANDGTSYIVAAGNNKLFKLSGSTLSELTYGGGGTAPTITDNNWQMAPLNGILYLYQAGHDPLIFDPAVSNTTYRRVTEKSGYVGTVSNNSCVISAYGRTWSANNTTTKTTIQFSDLQAGFVLSTGTAGSLDLSMVWPAGADEIVALAAHNGFLIVFGRRQILIYNNAQEPAAMSLQDAITGVGCFARDSVVTTGSDVYFLSDSGVKSLMRVIQEKSAPLRDISANVRDDLVAAMSLDTAADIKAVHSDKEGFYLITFPYSGIVYCFDLRMQLPNGAARATTWDGSVPTAFFYTRNKDLLLGKVGYIGKYDTYKDNTDTYAMRYYTNYFDFGVPTAIKIMKKVGVTTIGGQGYPVTLKFGYDYSDILNSRQFNLANAAIAEYNIAEFAIGEYGGSVFDNKIINIGGSGKVIQLGFETTVNTRPISIQKLDVFTKVGKTR